MSQCQSITRNGKQCTRKTLPSGRYCWQHNVSFLLTLGVVIPIILAVIGLWADLFSLGFLVPKERSNSTYANLMARGDDASNIGQNDEALNYYNQALVIVREIGSSSQEKIILDNISQLPKTP